MSSRLAGRLSESAVPVVFPVVPGAAGSENGQERQRGYTAGHAAGYTAGLRHAAVENELLRDRLEADHAALADGLQAASTAQLAAMRAARDAFSRAPLPLLADAEQTLFECSLALAGAVLGRELDDAGSSSRAALARAALARALAGSGSGAPVRVRMNPLDVAALEAASREASVPEAASRTVPDLAADPSLARGDAVAEFQDGFLDARIMAALDRARRELLGPDA